MHRDHELRLEELARRIRGVLRVHDEVAADRHQDQIGLVVAADQAHVAEQAGVAHVIDLEVVLELDDEAGRLAAEMALVLAGRRVLPHDLGGMLGAHLGDADIGPERRHGAALAEAHRLLVIQHAKRDQRLREPGRRVERRIVLLHDVGRVAEMVAVPMGDQHQVDLAERIEIFVLRRRLRIVDQPRVDHDHLSGRRGDLPGRLAQPQQVDFPGSLRARAARPQQRQDGRRPDTLPHRPLPFLNLSVAR